MDRRVVGALVCVAAAIYAPMDDDSISSGRSAGSARRRTARRSARPGEPGDRGTTVASGPHRTDMAPSGWAALAACGGRGGGASGASARPTARRGRASSRWPRSSRPPGSSSIRPWRSRWPVAGRPPAPCRKPADHARVWPGGARGVVARQASPLQRRRPALGLGGRERCSPHHPGPASRAAPGARQLADAHQHILDRHAVEFVVPGVVGQWSRAAPRAGS